MPASSTFRRKLLLCYGAQIRPDTSIADAAFTITGSGFDGFDVVGLSVYQYRNSATGFANTAGIVVKRGYQVYLDNCFVIAGDNSGSPLTGYSGIVFKHSDKDTGGLHCKLRNSHVLGSPNKIRASVRIEGIQNGFELEHCALVNAQTGLYITHPPEASDTGDTYYGYIINGLNVGGINLFESLDKGIEVVGRSGVAKSRFGTATVQNNRVESVTTWVDLTGIDMPCTDRDLPVFGRNPMVSVTNRFVDPNSVGYVDLDYAEHPGYLTGKLYWPWEGPTTSTAITAADTVYLYPFRIFHRVLVKTLRARVVTGGAGSSVKMAIYRNSPVSHRPLGAPVVADNTGVATTSSSTDISADVTDTTLMPGYYWMAIKATGTLPSMYSMTQAPYRQSRLGSNGTGPTNFGLSFADTYSNDMPTFSEGASFTEVGVSIPLIGFGT